MGSVAGLGEAAPGLRGPAGLGGGKVSLSPLIEMGVREEEKGAFSREMRRVSGSLNSAWPSSLT